MTAEIVKVFSVQVTYETGIGGGPKTTLLRVLGTFEPPQGGRYISERGDRSLLVGKVLLSGAERDLR